jgi:hypothetical protein
LYYTSKLFGIWLQTLKVRSRHTLQSIDYSPFIPPVILVLALPQKNLFTWEPVFYWKYFELSQFVPKWSVLDQSSLKFNKKFIFNLYQLYNLGYMSNINQNTIYLQKPSHGSSISSLSLGWTICIITVCCYSGYSIQGIWFFDYFENISKSPLSVVITKIVCYLLFSLCKTYFTKGSKNRL